MPGKVKVKICAGKNLPVMDRSSDTTDAYVEIKLGNTTYKTDVCRKSLHPQWNTDWYRFEVDDSELQDEPLQIRVMDHDTYSANDAIGKVYLNLNPLLLPVDVKYANAGDFNSHEISGWIPVYDTMHGIRGEVSVVVKVELFSDFNRFRQSSCGVQFFHSSAVPQGYYAKVIHGFVEELVVNDDPEYQWIDKIRTPRASNEARQTLFLKLSGQLQRKIGVKALDLGGNAVIGYKQSYDLEGESGVVARGIGTAVTLVKSVNICHSSTNVEDIREESKNTIVIEHHPIVESINQSQSPNTSNPIHLNTHRRSSDSDLSITPKGSSLTGSDKSWGFPGGFLMRSNIMVRSQKNFELMEYPFLTVLKYPVGFIKRIGGAVSARSVKRLETITNLEEPESRDTWWSELRTEIRSHARTFNCNAVLGYAENSTICDDICVLSASGTAAVIDVHLSEETEEGVSLLKQKEQLSVSLEKNATDKEKIYKTFESPEHLASTSNTSCSIVHLPYEMHSAVKATVTKCAACLSAKVPEIILTTIEPPDGIPSTGTSCLIDGYVYRFLKEQKEESVAKEISDVLPFLEYEMQRVLVHKLKMKGMNAMFGLKFNISVGEKMIIGVATATGMFLTALPSPVPPKLISDHKSDDKLNNLQQILTDTIIKNKEVYQIKDNVHTVPAALDEDQEEEQPVIDFSAGNKEFSILEVDDSEDAEVLKVIMEDRPPSGFHVVNTESIPGLDDLEIVKNLQFFTQIYRVKSHSSFNVNQHFHRLLQTIYFKLRRSVPCALCKLQFHVDIPEPDELQLCAFGMALCLDKKQKKAKPALTNKKTEEDLIFKLDEEQSVETDLLLPGKLTKHKQKSPLRQRHVPIKLKPKERFGIDITPLSYVPGGHIDRYLGNLNFFFIRETTSVREEGGLSGFIHSFISDVLAIVRAHVTAVSGNAIVAFFLTELILVHNLHKNQAQCLINVGGDAVSVSYGKEEN